MWASSRAETISGSPVATDRVARCKVLEKAVRERVAFGDRRSESKGLAACGVLLVSSIANVCRMDSAMAAALSKEGFGDMIGDMVRDMVGVMGLRMRLVW